MGAHVVEASKNIIPRDPHLVDVVPLFALDENGVPLCASCAEVIVVDAITDVDGFPGRDDGAAGHRREAQRLLEDLGIRLLDAEAVGAHDEGEVGTDPGRDEDGLEAFVEIRDDAEDDAVSGESVEQLRCAGIRVPASVGTVALDQTIGNLESVDKADTIFVDRKKERSKRHLVIGVV